MSNPIMGRLPPPHDCIKVSVTDWYGETWHVLYTGTPQQLVAAGIVDDDMVHKILSQRGGARIGKDGLPFKLKSGRVPAHVQWARDEVVGFDRKVRDSDQHKLHQLPGMRELLPDGLPTQEDRGSRENPGPGDRVSGSLSVQACVYAAAVGRVVSRARAVGRHRRLMRWSVVGDNIIAPDWSWMIGERLSARGGCHERPRQ